MNFNYKLGGAVAIATFVASVLAPAGLADTNIGVTNNGAYSNNTVTVNNSGNGGNVGVTQTNNSTIVNGVTVGQNTGKNKANFSTGDGTSIVTGDANSDVTVTVGGSSNVASGSQCGCVVASTNVNISDNGAFSNNNVIVNNGNGGKKNKNSQKNVSYIVNSVDVHQVTGKNKANFNTGGSTGIATGNTTSNVTVNVTGSANTQ
jgi:autotransporter family porin